jgi:hypothetical protein
MNSLITGVEISARRGGEHAANKPATVSSRAKREAIRTSPAPWCPGSELRQMHKACSHSVPGVGEGGNGGAAVGAAVAVGVSVGHGVQVGRGVGVGGRGGRNKIGPTKPSTIERITIAEKI